MSKKQLIVRNTFIVLIGIMFILLENVVGQRLILLMSLFIGLILISFARLKLDNRGAYTFILDSILILLIGMNSRYVINYYVYVLYMMLIIEAGLSYDFKYSKFALGLISAFTLYHYYILLFYRMNWGTVSEIIFMFLINVFVILIVVLAKRYQEEKEKQTKLNQLLLESNDKLEKLTRLEVKNSIARDIHDTFGHDMMALIMEIEMADMLVDDNPVKAREMLSQAKKSARNGMKTIRKVVETLRNDESVVTETIDVLIESFTSRIGMNKLVSIDPEIYNFSKDIHDLLYRLVQECLTNSVRHGEADFIEIKLIYKENRIKFYIIDNGIGCNQLIEGYGLKGMKERIEKYHGELKIRSEKGFEVSGYIEVQND